VLIPMVPSVFLEKKFSSHIKEVYNPEDLHPSRGMAGSDLRPLTNIPYCCLP
jgi:hypothetical protein